MVKTFEICAPSLDGEASVLNDVKAFFADKAFPLNVQVQNTCPFPLIVPNLRVDLDANQEGQFVARSYDELMRFVVSVGQIAYLNNVNRACVLCYADSSVIEEPEIETVEEVETLEEVEAVEPVAEEVHKPRATSMRKTRMKRTG